LTLCFLIAAPLQMDVDQAVASGTLPMWLLDDPGNPRLMAPSGRVVFHGGQFKGKRPPPVTGSAANQQKGRADT